MSYSPQSLEQNTAQKSRGSIVGAHLLEARSHNASIETFVVNWMLSMSASGPRQLHARIRASACCQPYRRQVGPGKETREAQANNEREKRTTAEVWGIWQSEIMASIKKEDYTDFYNKSKLVTLCLITAHSPIQPSFQNAMWNFDLCNTLSK